METATETTSSSPPPEIDGPHHSSIVDGGVDATYSPTGGGELQVCYHDDVFYELESLRRSNESLQLEKEEAEKVNGNLTVMISELTRERDSFCEKVGELEASFGEKEKVLDEELREKEEIRIELEVYKEKIGLFEFEKRESNDLLLRISDSVKLVKENLWRIVELLDDERVVERESNQVQDLTSLSGEIRAIEALTREVETGVCEFKESRKKEKKELENSVVSLTEENRDINSLLRIALVEKEAVEKSLNRLKGNSEQKRVALLQIAERGLQRVGFGFMRGSGSNEQAGESPGTNGVPASNKSDSSECEEEVVSLASTVERIMKNLRLEITQLRRSLDESRSDTERLQSLSEKQAKTIEENMMYIKELEDRERVLAQNVEELLSEIKATEEDVARWREACELEVEAGKKEMEERDEMVEILKKELEKTKTALDISNGKLKLKEELVAAAMAAQAAAEKSLQLADSRAAGLRERIEELTKQIEETESKERSRRKVRHICWPWRILRFNTANNTNGRVQNVRRMLPEMQSLLHYSV